MIQSNWPNQHFVKYIWKQLHCSFQMVLRCPLLMNSGSGWFLTRLRKSSDSSQASTGRRRSLLASWDPWWLFLMFSHQPRRPWTKTRMSTTTIRTGTRDSKILDVEDFEVLRSPDYSLSWKSFRSQDKRLQVTVLVAIWEASDLDFQTLMDLPPSSLCFILVLHWLRRKERFYFPTDPWVSPLAPDWSIDKMDSPITLDRLIWKIGKFSVSLPPMFVWDISQARFLIGW